MAKVMKSTDSSSLAEVVDRILDKGIVIDVWAKVSLVGIELLSIEARVVIASVETYLKYAEAIGLTATAASPAWSSRRSRVIQGRGCLRDLDSTSTNQYRGDPIQCDPLGLIVPGS